MKNIFKILFLSLLFVTCVDRTFDEPPVKEYTIPFTNINSIEELLSKYVAGKYVNITDELNIVGTVIADDKSGNFYKTLVIQDNTSGITVKIDRTGLFSTFPLNSKIGIKCKGLTIGDYGGLIQLGKGTSINNGREQLNFIPDNEVNAILFPGARNQPITPKKIGINSLRAIDYNTLIELENVEFNRSDINRTLANAGAGSFVDLKLVDCSNGSILLHTSDFSNFADQKASDKNGNIIAVLGRFNQNVQIYLRDTSDLKLVNAPCNSNGGNATLASIKSIRDLYTGTNTNVSDNLKIQGVVISDKDYKNINGQNIFIQDASGGITVRFTGTHNFVLNEVVEIDLKGVELSDFKGLLQLNSVPLSNARSSTNIIQIVPKLITIAELNNNFDNYESTLIEIKSVKLTKTTDSKYSFNVVATDATGNVNLFTAIGATFANQDFPIGTVDLVVIASEFDNKQILLRNTNDVTVTGAGSPTLKTIKEIRNLFSGSTFNISDDYIIKGIVISDKAAANIPSLNVVLQDASGGITIRFASNHNYALGDQLEVKVKGVELSLFSGLLQLNNTPNANVSLINSGNTITPKLLSIKTILENNKEYEGQLVQLENTTISKVSGTTYSGACILTDATGVTEMFTRSQAIFSASNFPTTTVKVIGIVSYFTDRVQINIRTTDDIKP